MKTQHTKTRAARSGFTLLELLAVITIISILLALILPAISGAMRNARNAQVSAEITRLETAISSFKAEYGIEPWSEILFDESGTWSDSMDPVRDAALKQSRSRIRRIWGSFPFNAVDLNGDGDATDVHELTGSEALVFFLGGLPDNGNVIGFSKNPLAPFSRTSTSRTDRLFEFDASRLDDEDDNDGFPGYKDPADGQTSPYHFVSSNNGQGYDANYGYYVDASGVPWKRDTHQIISPGEDGILGSFALPATPPYTPETELTGDRLVEADNITNFSGGTLN